MGKGQAELTRPRQEGDIGTCVEMAGEVRRLHGYPPFLPSGDLFGFLASPDALGAWVAEVNRTVVGHVALHRRSSGPVMDAATASLGLQAECLAVVARLLVSPAHRRSGVGRGLLDRAATEAVSRSLQPILDVGLGLPKAVALYDSAGWRRLGQVQVRFEDGTIFDEFVYAGPVRCDGKEGM